MATSLILHKRITTTVAKAKELKRYVEPLITKAKVDSTHTRRTVFSYLQNKESVTTLFNEVAGKIGTRPGGYTRILKLGNRLGDSAEMCILELVDYNDLMLQKADAQADTKKKRTRRGGKGKAESDATASPAAKTTSKPKDQKADKTEEKSTEDEEVKATASEESAVSEESAEKSKQGSEEKQDENDKNA